ncbi:hypothetical protein [Agriterribacter sp.]|uniref:hypothetical protein n=1 Tax=Agriterribacter sp. TaxID=2821509 RepID=UPI002B79F6BA|nr:hypothetical protein [Agriterribacter sp.]HTN09231.1 hypothetical protein [Agriterribacter sp.]
MSEGIYLDRAIIQGELFTEKRVYSRFEALVDIMSIAEDGTMIITTRKIAGKWGWGRKKVEIFLEQLEREGFITISKFPDKHIVTVLYKKSQPGSQKGASKSRRSAALQSNQEPERSQPGSHVDQEETEATAEEKKLFDGFNAWLKKNAPNVAKMKEQITLKQYLKIRRDMPKEMVMDLLQKMHNWKPLLQKNTSVYLTLKNWSRNPYNQTAAEDNKPSDINEQLKERFKK